MARMIDGDVVTERLRGWLESPHGENVYNSGYDDAIWHVLDVIEHMPTLTQPNEPLTWEELEKLKSSPVYIDVIGVNSYWALVRDINDCGVWLMTVDDIDDYGSHRLYGKTWLAYRRPPEGEEETE